MYVVEKKLPYKIHVLTIIGCCVLNDANIYRETMGGSVFFFSQQSYLHQYSTSIKVKKNWPTNMILVYRINIPMANHNDSI
jgi:hypothetical protein